MLWAEAEVTEARDVSTIRPPSEVVPREPGVHLSRIIRDMVDTAQPRQPSPRVEAARGAYIEVGEAFEDGLERELAARAWKDGEPGFRPDAQRLDGIWCSPDRLVMTERGPVIEEMKATWKSMRNGVEHPKFLNWWMQVAGYCWVWETLEARFRVLWVCGDYKPPIPARMRYDVRFTAAALQRNWEAIVAHGRRKGWLADEESAEKAKGEAA